MRPPHYPPGNEDRQIDLEIEFGPPIADLIETAVSAGYSPDEAITAVKSVAETVGRALEEKENTVVSFEKSKSSIH